MKIEADTGNIEWAVYWDDAEENGIQSVITMVDEDEGIFYYFKLTSITAFNTT